MPCIFCEIANGQRDASVVYKDDLAIAFHDLHPQAPTHILVIPREHVTGPLDFDEDNEHLAGHLVMVAAKIAQEQGIATDGYRLVMNQGPHGGQSVFHVHLHLLGGRRLTWPPG